MLHMQYCYQMIGVIVRLEKETFKVLTQHGKELHVPQHTVQKRNNCAVALDMNQVSFTMSFIFYFFELEIYFCSRYCESGGWPSHGTLCVCVCVCVCIGVYALSYFTVRFTQGKQGESGICIKDRCL